MPAISSVRSTIPDLANYGSAPVTAAAPTKDPVDLARCLNQIAMQSLLWYGGYKASPAPAQYAARLQVAQTIAAWWGNDACPSIPYMMDSLDRRMSQWNSQAQGWLVQPLYMMMQPRQWPWN